MTTIISFLSSIYIELLDGLSLLESDKATDTELSIIAVKSKYLIVNPLIPVFLLQITKNI